MKKAFLVLAVLAMLSVPAFAVPYVVTETTPLTLNILLGPTLEFDYMWDLAGSAGPGQPWDAGNAHVMVGSVTWLGSIYTNSDTGWLTKSFNVPLALQGVVQPVRFSVNDFGPNTDPVLYLDNIGSEYENGDLAPVPEPTTLLLLGGGLIGLLYRRRRFGA